MHPRSSGESWWWQKRWRLPMSGNVLKSAGRLAGKPSGVLLKWHVRALFRPHGKEGTWAPCWKAIKELAWGGREGQLLAVAKKKAQELGAKQHVAPCHTSATSRWTGLKGVKHPWLGDDPSGPQTGFCVLSPLTSVKWGFLLACAKWRFLMPVSEADFPFSLILLCSQNN